METYWQPPQIVEESGPQDARKQQDEQRKQQDAAKRKAVEDHKRTPDDRKKAEEPDARSDKRTGDHP